MSASSAVLGICFTASSSASVSGVFPLGLILFMLLIRTELSCLPIGAMTSMSEQSPLR